VGDRAGRKHPVPPPATRSSLRLRGRHHGLHSRLRLPLVCFATGRIKGCDPQLFCCFDPQGIDSARVETSGKNDCRFVVEGRTGQFAIHLQVLKEEREILHYKTELTPHQTVQMVVSARDLVFGGTRNNEDVEGRVHFTQKGPASGIAYASFRDPKGGTLLYFQNLTSLNEYCAITHAEPVGIVAGEWPEIGMALPAGSEPLPAKKQVTVSDAFLCFSDRH
jgi:hypothetical protein